MLFGVSDLLLLLLRLVSEVGKDSKPRQSNHSSTGIIKLLALVLNH